MYEREGVSMSRVRANSVVENIGAMTLEAAKGLAPGLQLVKGIATYVPGVGRLPGIRHQRTGGTDSARYCYSVWLRHLVMLHDNNLWTNPKVVAELGPGDSFGIGLSALLSGASRYYALDVVEYTDVRANLKILDELEGLFRGRASIPDETEFPAVRPLLDSYAFPYHILTDDVLANTLAPARIESIRRAIVSLNNDAIECTDDHDQDAVRITSFVPWNSSDVINSQSVDIVYSQAVMEHVDDLESTYRAIHRWLKPNGVMSHEIDFKCHGLARTWNGHWAYSDRVWKLMRGKRPYLLNREPHGRHVDLIQENGFEIICDIRVENTTGLSRERLTSGFQNLPDEDLNTSAAFVQAIKV